MTFPQEKDDRKTKNHKVFLQLAKDGILSLARNAPAVWRHPEQRRFYRDEQDVLLQLMDPLYWGVVITGFLFITFRVSGSRSYRHFRERYLWMDPNAPTWKGWIEEGSTEQASGSSLTGFVSDAALSLLVGCSCSLWLYKTNPKKKELQQQLVDAPLLPGKSLLHQHVCPSLVSAYDKREFDRAAMAEDETMRRVGAFIRSCKARSQFLGRTDGTVVPYPGLQVKHR